MVLQEKHWDPLLNWARSTFDVEIHKFNSILFNSQPEATKQKLGKILGQFDPWEMAGTENYHPIFALSVLMLLVPSYGACDIHDKIVYCGPGSC